MIKAAASRPTWRAAGTVLGSRCAALGAFPQAMPLFLTLGSHGSFHAARLADARSRHMIHWSSSVLAENYLVWHSPHHARNFTSELALGPGHALNGLFAGGRPAHVAGHGKIRRYVTLGAGRC
jgi:hypothetical protein